MANLPQPARLPERPPQPSLVRAAVSPAALAAAGAGVAVGLGALHSVVLAVVLAAGAWLGRMGAAVVGRARRARSLRPSPAELDPWSVPEPWRQLVARAADAQSRFDRALDAWPDGPVRDRLASLRPRLYASVGEVGSTARRGAALGGWPAASTPAGAGETVEELSAELRRTQAERSVANGGGRNAALDRREEALAAQLRARRGADAASAAVLDRLRSLVARLDETVTSLASLRPDAPGPEAAVAGLAEEIEALRLGLCEAAGAGAAAPSPSEARRGGPPPALPAP
jgi:hypothetical protein